MHTQAKLPHSFLSGLLGDPNPIHHLKKNMLTHEDPPHHDPPMWSWLFLPSTPPELPVLLRKTNCSLKNMGIYWFWECTVQCFFTVFTYGAWWKLSININWFSYCINTAYCGNFPSWPGIAWKFPNMPSNSLRVNTLFIPVLYPTHWFHLFSCKPPHFLWLCPSSLTCILVLIYKN